MGHFVRGWQVGGWAGGRAGGQAGGVVVYERPAAIDSQPVPVVLAIPAALATRVPREATVVPSGVAPVQKRCLRSFLWTWNCHVPRGGKSGRDLQAQSCTLGARQSCTARPPATSEVCSLVLASRAVRLLAVRLLAVRLLVAALACRFVFGRAVP
jgi:hypothetical protein